MPLDAYRRSADELLNACRSSGRLDELLERVDRDVLLLGQDPAQVADGFLAGTSGAGDVVPR
jgi:hypothetical protein